MKLLPRYEQSWNVVAKSLGHFFTSYVGDALQREIHVDWVARLQIILNALNY